MNPLAKIVNKLLAAIGDDPNYTSIRDEAQLEMSRHIIQLDALSENRFAPVLMQCAIMGLTEEDYEELEKHITARCADLKKRRAKEAEAKKMAAYAQLLGNKQSMYDQYKVQFEQLRMQSMLTKFDEERARKKVWWKLGK